MMIKILLIILEINIVEIYVEKVIPFIVVGIILVGVFHRIFTGEKYKLIETLIYGLALIIFAVALHFCY